MLRSMFSAVSGLRSHQTKMDVIGNNIANINTVGFKASRVTFQEVYNQTLKAASASTSATGRGGTNAHSVGLGVSVASIDVFHTQGGAQRTDKATDLSLDGDGFFILSDGAKNYYTRAGNFDEDPYGYLVAANGLKVQGWTTRDSDGNIVTTGSTREINLANLSMSPHASSMIRFEGNLNSRLPDDGMVEYTTSVFDNLGEEHSIKLIFSRVTSEVMGPDGDPVIEVVPNQWDLVIEPASEDSRITTRPLYDTKVGGARPIEFDGNGRLVYPLDGITIPLIEFNNGSNPIIRVDDVGGLTIIFDPEKMTQNDSESTFKIAETDGNEVRVYDKRHTTTPSAVYHAEPLPENRNNIAKEFLHHLETGEPLHPTLDIETNLNAMMILDAGYRSSLSGKLEQASGYHYAPANLQ
jgi:flagellar hook-basal body protein